MEILARHFHHAISGHTLDGLAMAIGELIIAEELVVAQIRRLAFHGLELLEHGALHLAAGLVELLFAGALVLEALHFGENRLARVLPFFARHGSGHEKEPVSYTHLPSPRDRQ